MKMADLLRQLADKLDGIDGPNASVTTEPNQTTGDSEQQPVMMTPNQQKLELLKKGVGVESEFDDEGNTELDAIKKNAGINPAVIHLASDDEPLE
mgnify:CR=1 FL=1|tara:strand:+ start:1702 stop:1986 length:285 start_codon:yes stop_codon:yes gene_type:complete